MSDVLHKFGRYFLMDLLAQGGMAEIYRARYASQDGAGRLLVIKRIQKDFGAQSEFLQMFRSEIKVSMGLNHPNIVQLFDFGEENGQPFIAMEFVDGRNLRQILNRCGERRQPFPVELAVAVIEGAVSGLEFAHTYRDKISGEHLKIVHRDISPQNILVSYEGLVKVIDFGIAKAKTNSEHTRAGVIKGKPSYLSPEQITGDPLDGRTDQFALGAVFWELLTGRKLFSGDNDLAVLKLIESCSTYVTPPSQHNPAVPKALDEVVMKMLARSPGDRFQTGSELERILRNFQREHYPEFGQREVSQTLKELFQKEIVEDRKKIQRLNDKVEQLLMSDIPDMDGTFAATKIQSSSVPTGPVSSHQAIQQAMSSSQSSSAPPAMATDIPSPPSAASRKGKDEETTRMVTRAKPQPQVEFDLKQATDAPRVILDPAVVKKRPPVAQSQHSSHSTRTNTQGMGSSKSSSGFLATILGWGGLGVLIYIAASQGPKHGFEVPFLSQFLGKSVPRQGPSPGAYEGDRSSPSQNSKIETAKNLLKFKITPSSENVILTVNGQIVDDLNSEIRIQVGETVDVSAEKPGFSPVKSSFVYRGEGEHLIQFKPIEKNANALPNMASDPQSAGSLGAAVSAEVGYLTVRAQFSAEAFIYDRNQRLVTKKFVPFEKLEIPVGEYRVKLVSEVLDFEDETTLKVDANRTTSYDGVLKPRKR